ncbi:hypothetical protein [Aquirhabdus sp.]|uniref:hypothetical protein n=1 Tax=Aquirhabdus sp. TaxID=2824160 RepID=UPI00396C97E5
MLTNIFYRSLFAGVLAFSLTSCATLPLKAPLEDRYVNLVNEDQLNQSRTHIENAKSKVLAVVFSKNTVNSLTYNAVLRERLSTVIGSMSLNPDEIAEDREIVLSEQGLMGALFLPLKTVFKEVRIVKSIPEGFEGGADYVGVMDLDLNFINLDSKFTPSSIIHNDHTANCSIIFIDPNLVAGPDVIANVKHRQETTPKFAGANNRDFMYAVKIARTKLVKSFAAQVKTAVSP